MNEKNEAFLRMQEIMVELQELESEASGLMKEHFPEMMDRAEAYQVFRFGSSTNPHDTTFETILFEIEEGEGHE